MTAVFAFQKKHTNHLLTHIFSTYDKIPRLSRGRGILNFEFLIFNF